MDKVKYLPYFHTIEECLIIMVEGIWYKVRAECCCSLLTFLELYKRNNKIPPFDLIPCVKMISMNKAKRCSAINSNRIKIWNPTYFHHLPRTSKQHNTIFIKCYANRFIFINILIFSCYMKTWCKNPNSVLPRSCIAPSIWVKQNYVENNYAQRNERNSVFKQIKFTRLTRSISIIFYVEYVVPQDDKDLDLLASLGWRANGQNYVIL